MKKIRSKILKMFICGIIMSIFSSCSKTKYYDIKWENYDGKLLLVSKVKEGNLPIYSGADPSKPSDEQFYYTFAGWTPEIKQAYSNAVYRAQFDSSLINAKIVFDLNGGYSPTYSGKDVFSDSIDSSLFFFDVTKVNYIFRGWDYNETQVFDEKGNQYFDPTLSHTMVFKARYSQTIKLSVKLNYPDAATVIGEGFYSYDSLANLSLNISNGYSFVGWYYNDILLSSQSTFSYKLSNYDVELKANFALNKYTVAIRTYNESLGSVTFSDYYTSYFSNASKQFYFNEKVTVSAYTKTSEYRFLGWFNGNTLVSSMQVYSFVMTAETIYLNARWDLFVLELSSSDSEAGVVEGGGQYSSNSKVEINAIPNAGYSFSGWYGLDNNCISTSSKYIFTMPTQNYAIEAIFSLNSYSVSLSVNNQLMGRVCGSGIYSYNAPVNVTAEPFDGYKFESWTCDGKVVSFSSNYSFLMPDKSVSLIAQFSPKSYTVTLKSSYKDCCQLIGAGEYLYNSQVTINAITNEGYSFDYWSDSSSTVSTLSEYSFKMPNSNIELTANLSVNSYKLIVLSSNDTKGKVSGGGTYRYGERVTVNAENILDTSNNDYSFSVVGFCGWYDGDKLLSYDLEYTFNMPNHDVTYTANFDGKVKEVGDTILFGRYPQKSASDVNTNTCNRLYPEIPTVEDNNGWTAFDWYKNESNSEIFAWYRDVDIDDDGIKDFRGVYFTSYRPYQITYDGVSKYSYQYKNGINLCRVTWYEYSPIIWQIVDINNGEYILNSKSILDCTAFNNYTAKDQILLTDYNNLSDTCYVNNYQYSNLRSLLNVDFYNTAFDATEKSKIKISSVDNSINSLPYTNKGQYTCDNTFDKVFAFSGSEISKLSSYKGNGRWPITNYAQAMGSWATDNSTIWLWTRSPGGSSYPIAYVYSTVEKYSFESAVYNLYGVLPGIIL